MKKFNLLGLSLVTTIASFTACTNDTEEILTQECEIRLTSEITPSRVANTDLQSTQIVSGRQVGVTINNAQTPHNNVAWTVGNTGQLTNTGDAIYYGDGAATITAYHPFNSTWKSTSHEFSVSTDQTEAAEYLNSDLLWATDSSLKTESAIKLEFAHKLAKINVTIVPENNGDDLNGATISICNTKISTTFNPSTGDITEAAGEPQEIIASVTANNVYTASAIVIPQAVSGKFIKITLGDKTYYYTLASSTTLAAGHSYNYTLTLKGKQLINTESGIGPWGNGGDNTGDAEEDVSKLIVTLTEAGTLGNYLTDSNKDAVEELKIIGNINGTDVQLIRDITNLNNMSKPTEKTGALVKLDLSEANIVAGGNPYTNYNKSKEIETKDNVITAYMFEQTQLKTIVLPNNITEIGDHAFECVFYMESIVIPEGVTKLGESAFNTSKKLKAITIPESVIAIGGNAFNECAFTEITLPSKVKILGEYTFQFCKSLKTINLPAELEEIKLGAFYFCESMESIIIPSLVKTIDYVFSGCNNLKEIHCQALTPPVLSTSTTNRPPVGCTIYVPTQALDAYKNSPYWKGFTIVTE